MCQFLDDGTLASAHAEINAALADGLHVRNAQQLLRVFIGLQVGFRVLALARPNQAVEQRSRGDECVTVEVAGEVAPYLGTVPEGDLLGNDNRRAILEDAAYCHARAEEEKRNACPRIESADLREHRERRVVDYDAILRIFGVLIVAAGVERPQYLLSCQIDHGTHILDHSLVDVLWSPAFVRGLRPLGELGYEALVVMEHDRVLAASFWPLHLGLLSLFLYVKQCLLHCLLVLYGGWDSNPAKRLTFCRRLLCVSPYLTPFHQWLTVTAPSGAFSLFSYRFFPRYFSLCCTGW